MAFLLQGCWSGRVLRLRPSRGHSLSRHPAVEKHRGKPAVDTFRLQCGCGWSSGAVSAGDKRPEAPTDSARRGGNRQVSDFWKNFDILFGSSIEHDLFPRDQQSSTLFRRSNNHFVLIFYDSVILSC